MKAPRSRRTPAPWRSARKCQGILPVEFFGVAERFSAGHRKELLGFVTNARPIHHRHPPGTAQQSSLICRSRGAPTPRRTTLGASRKLSNGLITIPGEFSGRQRAAETENIGGIRRGIKLTPYSGIF